MVTLMMTDDPVEEWEQKLAELLVKGVRRRMDDLIDAMMYGAVDIERYGLSFTEEEQKELNDLKQLADEEYEKNQALVRYLEKRNDN